MVYEEVTEGITRFVVVFQSTDADPIGPVRSVRPADPLIVAPLGGLLVFSGGAPNIVQLVRNAGLDFIDENATDALYRRSGPVRPPQPLHRLGEALRRGRRRRGAAARSPSS